MQIVLVLNVVPLRLNDIIQKGSKPQNIFQNYEGLNGKNVCEMILTDPGLIEKSWKE
jgi:hypothetical protein